MLNLRELYGQKYRVKSDRPRQIADRRAGPDCSVSTADEWYFSILCEWGDISLDDDKTGLMAFVKGRKRGMGLSRNLPTLKRIMDGDTADGVGEALVYFDHSDIKKVFRILHPRRRRQYTDEQKQRMGEFLASVRPDRGKAGEDNIFSSGLNES